MKTITKIILGLTVLAATSLNAADGATLYKKCSGCHGASGEKKALGKSAIIKGWEIDKTIKILKGYKDGTYGGAMKGVMKGQVANLDDKKIEEIAKFIESKK
jgi:cytochrome c553